MQTTIINDPEIKERCLALCRGDFQRNLILGNQRYSLADLKGKAKRYSGKYALSRNALINRIKANGFTVDKCKSKNGLIMLVIYKMD